MKSQSQTVAKSLTAGVRNSARCVAEALRSRRIRKTKRVVEGIEKHGTHYDKIYASSKEYQGHYTASCYHFLWCVLVYRIMGEGIQSVLDIGCGPGQFGAFLREAGLKRYCGLDFSRLAIEMARSTCSEYDFIVGDAFETDLFVRFEYDAVVCTEFLEHVQEDIDIIQRVRSGARFYATVPDFGGPSHVRCFSSRRAVSDRYGEFFRDFSVQPFLMKQNGPTFYVFEGTKL